MLNCGDENGNGTATITPPHQVSQPSNRGKKAAATALIVLFSAMLLTSNARMAQQPRRTGDLAGAIGELFGVLLLIAAVIFSIRWLLKLNGYAKTCGRQAVAIFLVGFCVLGLLLVLVLAFTTSKPDFLLVIPVVMAALYAASLYACIRWIRRLRRSEQNGAAVARAAAQAGG